LRHADTLEISPRGLCNSKIGARSPVARCVVVVLGGDPMGRITQADSAALSGFGAPARVRPAESCEKFFGAEMRGRRCRRA
jgi:hypothetical protein